MNHKKVLSISFNCFSKSQAISEIKQALADNKKIRVATVNNEICNIAFENNEYSDVVNSFELKVPDSAGVAWALKRQGTRTEVVKGVDLALDICELAQETAKSVFFLGGQKDVGKKSSVELRKQFPNIKIAGYLDGVKISSIHDPDLAKTISESGAQIVFVCLGAPKQELWINSNYSKVDSLVFVGLGGTLDFISKSIPRAPKLMRQIGLEWLFRFFVQPSRYKRIFSALIVFPLRVLFKPNKY
jgi:N-acetylglucosaminyldiphosphoundecaprenol N-acetyl-beta-D-mannosaminyltransferase